MLLNSFSNKWPLTGWTECCPRLCTLAPQRETLGTEEKSENVTAPVWSDWRLTDHSKWAESQEDGMMTTPPEISSIHPGSKPNQFLPASLAQQQDMEESDQGSPTHSQRSEAILCAHAFVTSAHASQCFECVINTSYRVEATHPLLLERN